MVVEHVRSRAHPRDSSARPEAARVGPATRARGSAAERHGSNSGRLHGGGEAPGGGEAGNGWYGFRETTRRRWCCWLGAGSTEQRRRQGAPPGHGGHGKHGHAQREQAQKVSEGVRMEISGNRARARLLKRHATARWRSDSERARPRGVEALNRPATVRSCSTNSNIQFYLKNTTETVFSAHHIS